MALGKKLTYQLLAIGIVVLGAPTAYAQFTAGSKLSQTISAGTLSTSFTNTSGGDVANPSFGLSNATISSTSNTTTTGSFGSDTSRVTVDNPGAATAFTLTLAAANPSIGWYENAAPAVSAYKHNGATASEGQLSITSAGTLGNYTGGNTGISGATTGTFTGTTPMTLMIGGVTMAEVWRGYVHSIGISQVIPAGTPSGSYSIDLVQTVAAS